MSVSILTKVKSVNLTLHIKDKCTYQKLARILKIHLSHTVPKLNVITFIKFSLNQRQSFQNYILLHRKKI